MKRVYLDNAATTPIDPHVIAHMTESMQELWGNPSSIYQEGRTARAALEGARKTVANALSTSIGEIFFTSGGTESNNMALKCSVRDLGVQRIISSPIEHHAVLHTLDTLKAYHNIKVEFVQLNDRGVVDMEHLENLLSTSEEKTLVSLMYSNNEIGTMINFQAVADLCEQYAAYFHSDSVQVIGFYPIDLSKTKVHFLTGSGHKFYGPKGVGFIYINSEAMLKPFIDGGAQERNMRGGTENLYGILGLAKALELAVENMATHRTKIEATRAYFAEKIKAAFPGVEFNGLPFDGGHYKVLSVNFPPHSKSDLLLFSLDIEGISVSGGSACSSGADKGSHVIDALHPGSDRKTIRFSFSHKNTKKEVDYVIEKLKSILD